MLLPPYRTPCHPSAGPPPRAPDDGCALCALRAALRTVRLRTVLLAGAVAASVALNVSGALAAAYSARLATQALAITNALTQASAHDLEGKMHAPLPIAAPPLPPPTPALSPTALRGPRGPMPRLPDTVACVGPGIASLGASEFMVDRSAIDRMLEGVAESMPMTRIVPERSGSELSGIHLLGVARQPELVALGFEDHDVVMTLNGFPMGDPEKALEAYARLRSADELEVMLSRKGMLRVQRYHVR